MSIGIMTDSHSSISREEAAQRGIYVLPMPFYVDGVCYYEDVTLSRDDFFRRMREGVEVSTSQQSPADVMGMWDEMLKEFDEILYMPISSGLSGSCQTAMALAAEEPYAGRVFVVDNGRVATPQHRAILDALELIDQGYGAQRIKELLESVRNEMMIYIGLSTLEYLKRGGRINPAVAAIGSFLKIKPIMQFDVGVLNLYRNCRKFSETRKEMIRAMKRDLEGRFREPLAEGRVTLLAATSASQDLTMDWLAQIRDAFPGMDVMCDPLSMGCSCHIGYDGLGIGCSCSPRA